MTHRRGPSRHPQAFRITTYRQPSLDPPSATRTSVTVHPPASPTAKLRRLTKQGIPPRPPHEHPEGPQESFSLTLPVPPSVNHQYATVNGRRLLSAEGRSYKAAVGQQVFLALNSHRRRAALLHRLQTSDLALSIRFFFTSRLRRDVDGGLKIAQDALCQSLGINDNRIVETHLYKNLDKQNPRIEVSLSSMVGTEPRDPHQGETSLQGS